MNVDQDLISQLVSQKLGPAPGGAPAGGEPALEQAPPAKPKADPAPTNLESAQKQMAPADKQSASPAEQVAEFIKLGNRDYTPQQLEGTLNRYKDLNYKWQTNKPIVDVVTRLSEAARAAGHEPDPGALAELVDAAVKAYVKNPTMGNQQAGGKPNAQGGPKPGMSPSGDESGEMGDTDSMYEQWEKENAVKLPPGFKEMAKNSQSVSAQLDKMMNLFQQVIQGGLAGQQSMDQSKQVLQQATNVKADAAMTMIGNNLNRAFAAAQIPVDPKAQADFRMFAAQRGYDFPDFMDPALAQTIVNDYKANKDAPEINRLREVAQKRQAFTGMVEGAPGTGGAPAPAGGDPMLASLISSAMGKKGF